MSAAPAGKQRAGAKVKRFTALGRYRLVCTKLQRRQRLDKVGEYQATLLRASWVADRFGLLNGVWSRLDGEGKTERSPSVGSRLTAWEVWADRIKPKLLQLKEAKSDRAVSRSLDRLFVGYLGAECSAVLLRVVRMF